MKNEYSKAEEYADGEIAVVSELGTLTTTIPLTGDASALAHVDGEIVASTRHGFEDGDLFVCTHGTARPTGFVGRLRTLLMLLWRPRVQYMENVSSISFTLRERRPTWREWRAAVWRALTK